jgi:hypothetical protein
MVKRGGGGKLTVDWMQEGPSVGGGGAGQSSYVVDDRRSGVGRVRWNFRRRCTDAIDVHRYRIGVYTVGGRQILVGLDLKVTKPSNLSDRSRICIVSIHVAGNADHVRTYVQAAPILHCFLFSIFVVFIPPQNSTIELPMANIKHSSKAYVILVQPRLMNSLNRWKASKRPCHPSTGPLYIILAYSTPTTLSPGHLLTCMTTPSGSILEVV